MPGKGTSWAKPIITADHLKVIFARNDIGMSVLRHIPLRSAAAPTPAPLPPRTRQKRGRPDQVKPPKDRKIRELYDRWRGSGRSLTWYAEEHLGVSRQNFSNWMRELTYPDEKSRKQIKERTEIEIGPRPIKGKR
jgi:hypothetical protein